MRLKNSLSCQRGRPDIPEDDSENEVRRHSSEEEETMELLEMKSVIQSTIV